MQSHAFFQVLKVSNDLEVLLELAVDLREQIDFDHVQTLTKLIHWPLDPFLAAFLWSFKLREEIFEIAHIENVVLLEIDAFYLLVALQ